MSHFTKAANLSSYIAIVREHKVQLPRTHRQGDRCKSCPVPTFPFNFLRSRSSLLLATMAPMKIKTSVAIELKRAVPLEPWLNDEGFDLADCHTSPWTVRGSFVFVLALVARSASLWGVEVPAKCCSLLLGTSLISAGTWPCRWHIRRWS